MAVGVVTGSEIGMYKNLYMNSNDILNAGFFTAVGNITTIGNISATSGLIKCGAISVAGAIVDTTPLEQGVHMGLYGGYAELLIAQIPVLDMHGRMVYRNFKFSI